VETGKQRERALYITVGRSPAFARRFTRLRRRRRRPGLRRAGTRPDGCGNDIYYSESLPAVGEGTGGGRAESRRRGPGSRREGTADSADGAAGRGRSLGRAAPAAHRPRIFSSRSNLARSEDVAPLPYSA
jgi:hypothetical protein